MYTIEDYKWNLNPRFIKIMCADNTHIHYLSEKEKERKNSKTFDGNNMEMLNDLGIPILGFNNNNE